MSPEEIRQLAALDPRQPWFAPYCPLLRGGVEALRAGANVATVLSSIAQARRAHGIPRFVHAQVLPRGEAYEAFVARTDSVPTRDNPHDFFNGMVWLQFTRSKRRLNELQAGEIERAGIGPVRGPLRDGLTLFDENGAVLDAPPALWEALLARDWQRLFVDLRPLWREARVAVFGHALLQKLATPRKDLTAHVWRTQPTREPGTALDSWLAAQLTATRLQDRPFTPLPVLGIPGWWPENENFSFYDDAPVFRPARRHKPKTTK